MGMSCELSWRDLLEFQVSITAFQFQWRAQMSETIDLQFHFRFHRLANKFPDRTSVECCIQSDGRISGHVRDLTKQIGFVPVDFRVRSGTAMRLRSLFEASISKEKGTSINVELVVGTERVFKHFPIPSSPAGENSEVQFWRELEAICQEAILQAVKLPDL